MSIPSSTAREIKKYLALELRNLVAQPDLSQIKKKSTVPGRSRHLGKDALELQITKPNADSGALLKVRTLALGA